MVIQQKQKIGVLIGLLVIAVVVWIFVFQEENNGLLKVEFFDVGQGDAEFIETPAKQQVLIDGGPDMSILKQLGKAIPSCDRYIDLIILTHPEQDHMNGLIEIIKRYNVGAIVTTGVIRDTEQYKEWINTTKERAIPIYIAKSGGQIDFGNNVAMNILYPFENVAGGKLSDSNNTSIVSKLIYNDFATLFTGDIEKSAENDLVNSRIDLNADILKIAHHGSKTSTAEAFLKAVNATLVVIEVGKDNQYGHPHQEVLDRLKDLEILQTAQEGNIKIISDGRSFETK